MKGMNKVSSNKNWRGDNFPNFECGPPVKKVAHACPKRKTQGKAGEDIGDGGTGRWRKNDKRIAGQAKKSGKDTELTERPKRHRTRRRKQWKEKQAWKKAEGRRRRPLVRLAVERVVAAVGTPVRGNHREGTSCKNCWSEACCRCPVRKTW